MAILNEDWMPGAVRVRAKARDPYEGLTGRDYINARGIAKPPIKRIQADDAHQPLLNFVMASGDVNFLKPRQMDRRFFLLPELTWVHP